MSPEWFEWLRKNIPPHMFEAFERDRIHGTKWRDDEISRIQSALAAETKRREEAEKMISLTAKVLGSPDTKTHCLHCWAEEIMKELGSAHDVVQTIYADSARRREASDRILPKINTVTAKYRHGHPICKEDLDALSNAQLDFEKALRDAEEG